MASAVPYLAVHIVPCLVFQHKLLHVEFLRCYQDCRRVFGSHVALLGLLENIVWNKKGRNKSYLVITLICMFSKIHMGILGSGSAGRCPELIQFPTPFSSHINTSHSSLFTFQCSFITADLSPHTHHCLLLIIHFPFLSSLLSLPTIRCSSLTTYSSLLHISY